MHDETCEMLAGVLGRRNEGFMQMTISSGSYRNDRAHMEKLSAISGWPLLWNVVQANDHKPEVHRGAFKWLDESRDPGVRVYGQGLTTDAGFTFTIEDWNLWDDRLAWREATVGSVAERLEKLTDPARRDALKAQVPLTVMGPIADIVITGPRSPRLKNISTTPLGRLLKALANTQLMRCS